MAETDKGGRRSRRGRGRADNARREVSVAAISQIPWTLPENPDVPTEPLNEESVQAIHDGAMRILEEIGIEFIRPNSFPICGRD